MAARTTRRTGAPIMTAMFLCVEWRVGALLRVRQTPRRPSAIVIVKKYAKEPWLARWAVWRRLRVTASRTAPVERDEP